MMQNHLEIPSESKFLTRSVRNWSKSLTESLHKVYGIYGIFQDLSRRFHKGPYGPQPGPGPNPDWAPTRPQLLQLSSGSFLFNSSSLANVMKNLLCIRFSSSRLACVFQDYFCLGEVFCAIEYRGGSARANRRPPQKEL